MEKTLNEKITISTDSQTAIQAIQNNMRSSTLLTCMKNLHNLGDSNDVTITWTPGNTGIYSNEKAGVLAKSGSALKRVGLEPVIPISNASVRAEVVRK